MFGEQFRESIYVSAFQLEAHQSCCSLNLGQSIQCIRLVSDIASHNVTEQVPCKSSLPCIDQGETAVQFVFCFLFQLDLLYLRALVHATFSGDVLQSH